MKVSISGPSATAFNGRTRQLALPVISGSALMIVLHAAIVNVGLRWIPRVL